MRIAIANHRIAAELRQLLSNVADYHVAWIVDNGRAALRQCELDRPDLLILDADLPEVDGIEVARQIMDKTPCPILLVTDDVKKNTAKVFKGIGYGAIDAVDTPTPGNAPWAQLGQKIFLRKVHNLLMLHQPAARLTVPRAPHPGLHFGMPPLVALGSSTGGPKMLVQLLGCFPADFPATIVIVQHLDKEFSANLADWLNSQIALPVGLAREGAVPERGRAYVAGTNDHLILTPALTFAYSPEPLRNPYRPSVDVFFHSVADEWPDQGCAALLTGMGRDGAVGLGELRRAGWHTIAQDQATSVVYGMPKAAKELGAACEVLSIQAIGPAILQFLRNTPPRK